MDDRRPRVGRALVARSSALERQHHLDLAAPDLEDDELLRLNEALDRLTEHDARKAELVKHHYFVGLEFGEVAAVMGISVSTAKRDWAYARAWLFGEMKKMG